MRGRRPLRLHADDLDVRPDRLAGDTRAGGAAAATDGDDDDVDVRLLFERFQRMRADSRDEVRLIAGVDVAIAVLARELLAVLAGVVEVFPDQHHLSAEVTHASSFTGLAFSGAQTMALTPNRRAPNAIDCP